MKQVVVSFTVSPSQSVDTEFALEFRLLAHGPLPFGFKSVTVRRTAE